MTNAKTRLKAVELHICTSPEFTRKFGKRVKAAGGRYSSVRGDGHTKRYVTVPVEAADLATEIYNWNLQYCDRKTTVIARLSGHDYSPSWLNVFYFKLPKDDVVEYVRQCRNEKEDEARLRSISIVEMA